MCVCVGGATTAVCLYYSMYIYMYIAFMLRECMFLCMNYSSAWYFLTWTNREMDIPLPPLKSPSWGCG